jgi:AraC-like DNA-binding protein
VHRVGAGRPTFEQPVLPDGCLDVVALPDRVVLAGPATRATTVRLGPDTQIVGARFRTGAAPPVVGARAGDLRDLVVPLDELWGAAGGELTARALAATHWRARLQVLVSGLAGRLGRAPDVDPVATAVPAILASDPGRPLAQLANDIGLSERQLRRRVEDAVGYPPRMLARVLRFQRFLRAARASGRRRRLAELAADTGFADQAHLTRESRALSGLPPAALLSWEDERLTG